MRSAVILGFGVNFREDAGIAIASSSAVVEGALDKYPGGTGQVRCRLDIDWIRGELVEDSHYNLLYGINTE